MQDTLFVGREQELVRLQTTLDKALAGQGQVCFVAGAAGSGKSALVESFIAHALGQNPQLVVATGVCDAQIGLGDPYLPFREALAILVGTRGATRGVANDAANVSRLRRVLAVSAQVLFEVAPDLIGLVVPGANLVGGIGKALAEKAGWTEHLKKQVLARGRAVAAGEVVDQSRIFEQYAAFLHQLSQKTPLVLFLDDLHWADNPSIALLFHLGRHVQASRILILGTYRPHDIALGREGGRHPLEGIVHELARYQGEVVIDLDSLSEQVGRAFVDALIDAEPNHLGEPFRSALYHRTGGHALFTVEMLRAMQARGDLVRDSDEQWVESPLLDWSTLPARVEGVIESRITRLDERLRQVLAIASVEGENFSAEVIAQVEHTAVREMVHILSGELERRHRLVANQGLAQLGPVRLSLHRFVHNLFQQYLYGSLTAGERVYLHLDVGNALEAIFAGQTDMVAAYLARHFDEAGVLDKAAAYRHQAGEKARRLSANQEAVDHFRRGLVLVEGLPAGPQRTQIELALQMSLGATLIATHGYPWWEVEQAFGRARTLCRDLGDPPQLIPVLYGQFLYRVVRGELWRAVGEAEHILALCTQASQLPTTPGILAATHGLYGAVLMYLGRMGEARQHLEQALALYDSYRDRELAYQLGHDTGIVASSYLSWVLWFLGEPDQARQRQVQALDAAAASDHAYSQALGTVFAAVLEQMMGHRPEVRWLAEETLRLSRQRSFPFWVAMAQLLRGWALVHEGDIEAGLAEQREGLAGWERSGMGLALPYFYGWLAEAHRVAARRAEGLQVVAESLAGAARSGECWRVPEQHRVQAELLLLAPGHEAEAEAALRQALAVAGSHGNRALALRSAASLAQLLEGQGREEEARALLAAWPAAGS